MTRGPIRVAYSTQARKGDHTSLRNALDPDAPHYGNWEDDDSEPGR